MTAARVPGPGACGVAAVVLALLPFTLSGLNQVLASKVALYFIAILGLNIVTGYTGQISIGHGAFMAIGGYTTAIMSHDHHTNLIATLPLVVRDRLRVRASSSGCLRRGCRASTWRSRRWRSPSRCRS